LNNYATNTLTLQVVNDILTPINKLKEKLQMIVTISDNNKNKTIEIKEKKLISTILSESGFSFSMPCGGKHICGKCKVFAKGNLSEPSLKEQSLLQHESKSDIRFACMTYVLGDTEIKLINKETEILTDGYFSQYDLNPSGINYGFAVDIGTTTVAVYGYDLKEGILMCKDSFLNPQSIYGTDVISRIQSSIDGNSKELQNVISDKIQKSILRLCDEYQININLVDNIVITGNTTMLYLLLNKNVRPLASAPFLIDDFLGRDVTASQCGFTHLNNANIYLPRTMSSFIGSDITCSVLAARDLIDDSKSTLLVDIGTNGEMTLFHNNQMLCCSTAAGPAFEGVGITMGVMAESGAINKVYLENNNIMYTTIKDKKPIGICGSGLVDSLAVFLSLGYIDESGYINIDKGEYITEYNGKHAISISDSGNSITQADVRAAQLAKAAICAGIYSLLNEVSLKPSDVDRLIIAGGFGSYIDVKNAAIIRMIPEELATKSIVVGNAAGAGASMILLSEKCRIENEETAKKAEIVDLSTSPYFMEKFVDCIMF